jgi:hypothetical protein
MEKQTLADVMPHEFVSQFKDTRAYKFHVVRVAKEHENYWIGKHKNVFYWVELENGYAVGWNENPARGWSFPIVKMKEKNV